MRDELNLYEQIDRYLHRQLTGEELSDFESKMKADASFAEEVSAHRLVHELVVDRGLLDIKKKLQAIETGKNISRRRNWKLYTGLFSVAVLVSIGSFIFYHQTEPRLAKVTPADKKTLPGKPMVALPPGKTTEKKYVQPTERKVIEQLAPVNKTTIDPPEKSLEPVTENTVTSVDKHISLAPEKNYKETQPENQSTEKENTPCQLGHSTLQITTQESCINSPTGKIVISKTSSLVGQAPFLFSIDASNFIAAYTFENIYAGTYVLTVKDARGCIGSDTEVRIDEKDCRLYEYAFYPARQEIWKFPMENNTNGKIEIYNKTGALVYRSQIINNYPDSWNGMSEDQALPMGSYSFILRSEEQMLYGNVTLLR